MIFSIMIYFIINLIVNIINTIIKMVSIKNGKGKNDVEWKKFLNLNFYYINL